MTDPTITPSLEAALQAITLGEPDILAALVHPDTGTVDMSKRVGAALQPLLHYAATIGDPEVIATLLASGAQTEWFCAQYGRRVSAVGAAVTVLNDANVAALCAGGASPDTPTNEKPDALVTPLLTVGQRANSTGAHAVANALLLAGADVNIADHQCGATALHHACERGDSSLETVAVLLAHGAEVEQKDGTGRTALHLAANTAGNALVGLLLSAGASPRTTDNKGNTPLHYVSLANGMTAQGATSLIDAGADPNVRNNDGKPPLEVAVLENDSATARFLLAHGADPHALASTGMLMVLEAIERTSWTCVHALLDAGADPSGGVQMSSVEYSVKHKRSVTALRVLEYVSDAGVRQHGWSVVKAATIRQGVRVINQLFERGLQPADLVASLNPSIRFEHPLHYAARAGSMPVVHSLLAGGVDINTINEHSTHSHVLFVARERIVPDLIAAGADVSFTEANGDTPLSCTHSCNVAALLVAAGADIGAGYGIRPRGAAPSVMHLICGRYGASAGNMYVAMGRGLDPVCRSIVAELVVDESVGSV